jgi:hypothetical protein
MSAAANSLCHAPCEPKTDPASKAKASLTVAESLRMWSLRDRGLSSSQISYELNKTRGFSYPLIESIEVAKRLTWLRRRRT